MLREWLEARRFRHRGRQLRRLDRWRSGSDSGRPRSIPTAGRRVRLEGMSDTGSHVPIRQSIVVVLHHTLCTTGMVCDGTTALSILSLLLSL